MKLKGPKYRIIEVPINDLTGDLYEVRFGSIYIHNLEQSKKEYKFRNRKELEKLYFRIYADENNSEYMYKFEKWEDKKFIDIIQDKEQVNKYFYNLEYHSKHEKALHNWYRPYVGVYLSKDLGNNFYEHWTETLRAMEAPEDGIIYADRLIKEVKKGNFLFAREGKRNLNFCEYKAKYFKGYLCDANGNILSSEPFPDNTALPKLDKAAQFDLKKKRTAALDAYHER